MKQETDNRFADLTMEDIYRDIEIAKDWIVDNYDEYVGELKDGKEVAIVAKFECVILSLSNTRDLKVIPQFGLEMSSKVRTQIWTLLNGFYEGFMRGKEKGVDKQ